MTAYFVTRHKGAVEWARGQGMEAELIEHLDPDILKQGDIVMGTLPVHIAAEVCARGCSYRHLIIDVPLQERGQNLSAEAMEQFSARLEDFDVRALP